MERVVIAGAGSFIGNEVLNQFWDKYEIIALIHSDKNVNDMNDNVRKNIKFIRADMEEYGARGVIKDIGRIDYYIPLFWSGTNRQDRDNSSMNDKSYAMVMESIKAAVDYGTCKKVVTVSSQMVYGDEYLAINDKRKPFPYNAYGRAKLRVYREALKFCYSKNVEMNEIRFWNVYGSKDHKTKMINDIIEKLINNEDVYIKNSDKNWDFLHVKDAASLINAVLQYRSNKIGEVFNALDGRRDSLGNFIRRAAIVCKSKSNITFGNGTDCLDRLFHRCDISKLKNDLLWEPKVSFEEGIREFLLK